MRSGALSKARFYHPRYSHFHREMDPRRLARWGWGLLSNCDALNPQSDQAPGEVGVSAHNVLQHNAAAGEPTRPRTSAGTNGCATATRLTTNAARTAARMQSCQAPREAVSLRVQIGILMDEINKLRRDARCRDDEIISLLKALREHESDFRNLKAWGNKAKIKMRKDEETIAAQREKIDAFKDDIFKLQPKDELPDTEFVAVYNSLCDKISTWVDGEIAALEKCPALLEHNIRASRFGDMLRTWPLAGEFLLTAVVHYAIQEEMFSEGILLLGLPRHMSCVLAEIGQCIKNQVDGKGKLGDGFFRKCLTPARIEFKSSRRWQIDGIKAVAMSAETAKARTLLVPVLANKILESIMKYFPGWIINDQTFLNIQTEIVIPAMEFEYMIHTSPLTYLFEKNSIEVSDNCISRECLAQTTYIELVAGRKISTKVPVESIANGTIGSEFFVLEPMFYRIEGDLGLKLRPAKCLMKLFHPLRRSKHND